MSVGGRVGGWVGGWGGFGHGLGGRMLSSWTPPVTQHAENMVRWTRKWRPDLRLPGKQIAHINPYICMLESA